MEAKDQRKIEKSLKAAINTYVYARIAQLDEITGKDTGDSITYELIKDGKASEKDASGTKKYKNVFTIGPHIPQFLRMMFEALLSELNDFRGKTIPMATFVNDLNNTTCATWLIPPYLYTITLRGCEIRYDTSLLSSYIKNVIDLPLAEVCMRHFDRLLIHLSYIIGSIVSAHAQPLNDKLFIGALNMITMDPDTINDMLSNMREPKKKAPKKEGTQADKPAPKEKATKEKATTENTQKENTQKENTPTTSVQAPPDEAVVA